MEPLFRTQVPPYRLGELLLRIAERRLTGRLLLTSELGERVVYIHTGYPVFAYSSQFSERLGAVGVRYGILKREDVAAALNLAREQGCEIGRAFLELGAVNGTQLFRLLGAQLIEQLAGSCGPSPVRARFLADPDALGKVAILRVHAMTAVLATVRHMASAEQTKLLGVVSERRVTQQPLPEPARQWLSDLGYLGDPDELTQGTANTLTSVRARLIAKLPSSTQEDFDPAASPVRLDVRKEDSVPPGAHAVADYIALTLLLSGALKLDAPLAAAQQASEPQSTSDSLRAAVGGGAARVALGEIPPAPEPPVTRKVDLAIRAYLEEKRDARTAARLAIWGAAAEVADGDALNQLLTLYLTLKPETNDAAVLDVRRSDTPEKVEGAYRTYRSFLDGLAGELDQPLARTLLAELDERIGDAFRVLAPGLAPPSDSQPDGLTAVSAADAGSGAPSSGPDADMDALLRSVEARVREGHWQKVVDTIEPLRKGRALPPTLALALALAQRELVPRRRRYSRFFIFLAFVLGGASVWLYENQPVVSALLLQLQRF